MTEYKDFYAEWMSDADCVVAHTSGSTGKPKEIHLPKSDMIASARATNAFFGIGRGSVLVCPLSLDYIAAKMMAVRSIIADARLVMMPPSNTLTIDGEVDLLAIVPSQVDSLLAQPHLAKAIHNIIIGGAPLSDERRKQLIAAGFNAYETYGMTETCSHVALKHIRDNAFTAIAGVTFATDSRGCLVVNVPHMSINQVVTNDVVELHGSSSFTWLGRYDNVINTGGIKVHPEVLEREIADIIGDDCIFFVTGEPHPKWGQQVVMAIVTNAANIPQIEAKLAQKLDHRVMPKKIIAVDGVKRTANGKIIRQILGQ
jgi:O-succinylbenzoic acid--CoA ligase